MILFQPHLSGVSGDMLLGALLGLGADPNLLRRFEGFAHPDVRVTQVLLKTVPEGPLVTHSVDLVCEETETHRHPQEMEALLGETARYLEVSPQVHDQALRTLRVLIDAEAHAHGQPSEQVHLHEVGRFDTVFDLLGTFLLLEDLGDPDIRSTPPRTGTGWISIDHGRVPVPVPAVREIGIRYSVPLLLDGPPSELTTPTGLALLVTCAQFQEIPPPAVIHRSGYGRGSRTLEDHPNLLAAHLLEQTERGRLIQMETVLDDITGEEISRATARLAPLAREVVFHPGTGKKGRPLWTLRILAAQEDFPGLLDLVFKHTPTRGVRYWPVGRLALTHRTRVVQVETPEGPRPLRWKISRRGFHVLSKPESDDVTAIFDPFA